MPSVRLSLAALVLLLSACDTGGPARATSDLDLLTPEPIDWRSLSQDPTELVGTWEWVASISESFGGETVSTPASTGQTETWIFRADGTATRVENGQAVFEITYRVARREYGNGTRDEVPSIEFERGGYGLDFGTTADALVLDSRPVDGPQARYRRR